MNTIIEYINDNEYEIDFDAEKTFAAIADEILSAEGCKDTMYISVSFVDEDTIRQLNNNMREIDKVTDVLSFPNIPFESPSDFQLLDGDTKQEYYDMDAEAIFLGDVVICYKRACEQAVEYGHSLKRELCFLTAHSILHLLGYDHMEDDERLDMEARQKKALDNLGITR